MSAFGCYERVPDCDKLTAEACRHRLLTTSVSRKFTITTNGKERVSSVGPTNGAPLVTDTAIEELQDNRAHIDETLVRESSGHGTDNVEFRSDNDGDGSGIEDTHSANALQATKLMQVSSKHLSLASKLFEHMFQNRPRHLDPSAHSNKIHVKGEGPDKMRSLLCVVHGFNRQVPHQLEKDEFLQVVQLIDKYEFHEAAEVFIDMRFESLQPAMPVTLAPDLAAWIYMCWHLELYPVPDPSSVTTSPHNLFSSLRDMDLEGRAEDHSWRHRKVSVFVEGSDDPLHLSEQLHNTLASIEGRFQMSAMISRGQKQAMPE